MFHSYKIRWINKEYNSPTVIITENGWPDNNGLEDNTRIKYLHDHLNAILDGILDYGFNIKGHIGKCAETVLFFNVSVVKSFKLF